MKIPFDINVDIYLVANAVYTILMIVKCMRKYLGIRQRLNFNSKLEDFIKAWLTVIVKHFALKVNSLNVSLSSDTYYQNASRPTLC